MFVVDLVGRRRIGVLRGDRDLLSHLSVLALGPDIRLMTSYHAPESALANFWPDPSERCKTRGTNRKQVDDLTGNLRGIENGLDTIDANSLQRHWLPGLHGLDGWIAQECSGDIQIRGVNQLEPVSKAIEAVER
jgi:hypothetical protein